MTIDKKFLTKLHATLLKEYGPRCKHLVWGCVCCAAWMAWDLLIEIGDLSSAQIDSLHKKDKYKLL